MLKVPFETLGFILKYPESVKQLSEYIFQYAQMCERKCFRRD